MARNKRPSRLTQRVAPTISLERDRRRERRGPVRRKAKVTVLNGLMAGDEFDVITRDASLSGSAFFLRDQLPIGTRVRVTEFVDEQPHRTHEGEIIRTRPISLGRHEMAVRYAQPELVRPVA